MTIEQLRNVHQAQSFRPFRINMADSRSLRVPYSEFLSHSESGRTIIVHQPGDEFSVVDLLLVNELEVDDSAPASSKGNGSPR